MSQLMKRRKRGALADLRTPIAIISAWSAVT